MLKFNAKIAFYDAKCFTLKYGRWIKGLFQQKVSSNYLFVLSPPYCGSTLLNELLCTSPNVSSTNIFGTREGLGLPEVRKLIDYRKHWEDGYAFPWEQIKNAWHQYWDLSKPVLLDKSQPALIRGRAMELVFQPTYFIALVRNPYALCESYMRRDKMNATDAADFAIRCLKVQYKNYSQLKNVYLLKYEDLTDAPEQTSQSIITFLPNINKLEVKRLFKAHNFKNKALPMRNLNQEKLKKMRPADRIIIESKLQEHLKLLAFLGY